MDEARFKRLIKRYLNNTLTAAEWKRLHQALTQARQDQALRAVIESVLNSEMYRKKIPEGNKDRLFERIMTKAAERNRQSHKKRIIYFVSAAAIVCILLGYWGIFNNTGTLSSEPVQVSQKKPQKSKKVELVLSNGNTLVLDSTNNGVIAYQGNASIVQQKGMVLYRKQKNEQENKITYNQIKVPRGKQFMVVLPDGSKVWLNAASSLHFPTAFKGEKREVSLTGEGYFEIEKNEDTPFLVHAHTGNYKADILVLGTRFNIKAYENGEGIRTTLLEGKVRMMSKGGSYALSPGEAMQLQENGHLQLLEEVSIQEAVAWKNGLFYFNDTDIKTVMQQIERWYDKKVVYKGKVNAQISGLISRSTSLPKVLQMLELTKEAHFTIKGNEIVISTP